MPRLSELVFEANRMAVCCSTYRNLLSPGAPGCVNRRDPRHIDLQMVIIIPDREQIRQLLRARLTRLFIVPTAQPQRAAASSGTRRTRRSISTLRDGRGQGNPEPHGNPESAYGFLVKGRLPDGLHSDPLRHLISRRRPATAPSGHLAALPCPVVPELRPLAPLAPTRRHAMAGGCIRWTPATPVQNKAFV